MANYIIGAGLAGLIAACRFEGDIFEAGPQNEGHKALLRFRDESVSKLTGIPFRAVEVHKNIIVDGDTFHKCSNAHANLYAQKVVGKIVGRSIRNLESVQRYVAPDDFWMELIERHWKRIHWESPINGEFVRTCSESRHTVISTMPMHAMLDIVADARKQLHIAPVKFTFERSSIGVVRIQLDDKRIDTFQTNYFPGRETSVYRASITGSLLIIEFVGETVSHLSKFEIEYVLNSFGIDKSLIEGPVEITEQKYGKIVDIPKELREAMLYELTHEFGIYSLGRFATWRNILLDDVAQDIERISSLINASRYGRALIGA